MEEQDDDHVPGSPDASEEEDNVTNQNEKPTSIINSTGKGRGRKSSSGNLDNKLAKIPKFVPEKVTLETKYVVGNEDFLSRSSLIIVQARQETGYCVGDLIWARIQGFCFWPAIITIDPVTGMFFKFIVFSRSKC